MLNFLIMPVAGGIIGYFTNWLAIKMLFRPHTEKFFLGFKIPFTPGLIPKERLKLSKKIGEVTGEYVLTKETLIQYIESQDNKERLKDIIETVKNMAVDDVISMVAKENKPQAVNRIEEYLSDFLTEMNVAEKLPAMSDSIMKYLEQNPEFDDSLRRLTSKLIDENVGKLAGLFINSGKVYDNIKKSLLDYLSQEENRLILEEKLHLLLNENVPALVRKILSLRISDVLDKLSKNSKEDSADAESPELNSFLNRQKRNKKADDAIFHLVELCACNVSEFIASSLDVSGIVEEKINSFEMEEAENIIISVVKRELNAITYLGGLLGFIIGLIPPILQLLGIE